MMQGFRRHLTFANATSLMALTVALGGTSYAAITLPRNSVSSTRSSPTPSRPPTSADSVTSVEGQNGTLRAADFAAGQLPAGPRGANVRPAPPAPRVHRPTGPGGHSAPPGRSSSRPRPTSQTARTSPTARSAQRPAGDRGGGRGDDTLSEETILTNTRPAISMATRSRPPTARRSPAGGSRSSTPSVAPPAGSGPRSGSSASRRPSRVATGRAARVRASRLSSRPCPPSASRSPTSRRIPGGAGRRTSRRTSSA